MQKTSKIAAKTLEKLRAAALPGGYAKFKPPGPYMPIYAELLDIQEPLFNGTLELWAIAHTYTKNGDLMRDPEIVFIRSQGITGPEGEWYPVEYRQDPYGVQHLAEIGADLMPVKFYPKQQRETAQFCTEWMMNIRLQGHLNHVEALEAAQA